MKFSHADGQSSFGCMRSLRSPAGVRLVLVGPMPPPVHGQSVVMARMVDKLGALYEGMRTVDTSAADSRRWRRLIAAVRVPMAAARSMIGSDVVYIAAKAGNGMWQTTLTTLVARAFRARIFVHHHSYAYVRQRQPRMVALMRAAGPRAVHIVLSSTMERDLRVTMPEIRRTLVVGNAGLVDPVLMDLPPKADSATLVLGHLSNLSLEKGIVEVVDLATALTAAGAVVRLIVAGPAATGEALIELDRARRELGESFEYRGAVQGADKVRFFNEITHFVFPSRYPHEAVPLVLYEAMASGSVCVATRQGAIAGQLAGAPSILAENAETFVREVVPALLETPPSATTSQECRNSFLRALAASERDIEDLVTAISEVEEKEESTCP